MRRHQKSQVGMTLMEIMVVIFLLGLVFAVGMPNFNALTHAKLRKDATRLAGTIRYLYNQAAMKGLCMRLKFDLKKNKYQVEVSTDGRCLIDSEQNNAYQAKKKEEEKKRKEKLKKEKKSEDSSTTLGGWSGERPISLEVKKATFQQFSGGLLKARPLSTGVTFDSIFVSHQKEPYSKDKGPQYTYLHCLPLGRCQRAMIYLKDARNTIFSLEIKPLTGRVVVHPEKVELSDTFTNRKKGDDDDDS